jgi:hypothetical protein
MRLAAHATTSPTPTAMGQSFIMTLYFLQIVNKMHSRCFDVVSHGNGALNLVVKLSVELGYIFPSLRL